jgi:hypothetical protein
MFTFRVGWDDDRNRWLHIPRFLHLLEVQSGVQMVLTISNVSVKSLSFVLVLQYTIVLRIQYFLEESLLCLLLDNSLGRGIISRVTGWIEWTFVRIVCPVFIEVKSWDRSFLVSTITVGSSTVVDDGLRLCRLLLASGAEWIGGHPFLLAEVILIWAVQWMQTFLLARSSKWVKWMTQGIGAHVAAEINALAIGRWLQNFL